MKNKVEATPDQTRVLIRRNAEGVPTGDAFAQAVALLSAAKGLDVDVSPPDDAEKAQLRAMALTSLRAELAEWSKVLESGSDQARATLFRAMAQWQTGIALASVRDPAALTKLPPEEQKLWRTIWANVETLLSPDDPWKHTRFGEALSEEGRRQEAIAEFAKAVRLAPRDGVNCFSMSLAMSGRGCNDQALELLKRAADWDAENNHELGMAIWRLAEILRDFGRYDEAAATYRRILGRRQAGPDDLRKARDEIALTEVHRRSHAARAAALAGCGLGKDNPPPEAEAKAKLRSQALDWFKTELSALDRTNAPGVSEDKTILLRTLAYWKSNSDLAGVRASEALDGLPAEERKGWSAFWSEVDTLLKPHDPRAHVRAGEALSRKGLRDAAAAEFREAVRLAPDDGANCFRMAMAMQSQGHVDPAIDLLRRALKWDLEHNDHMGLAFWELGRTLRKENRFDDAIATFRRVREQKGFSSDDIHLADEEITATERERSVMGRLLELVKRQQPVDSAEALELARLAAARSLHAAAARFWTSFMASNLPISEPHQAQFHVEALRSAVLAGCGQGKDAPADEAAKARLRSQAREWLKASLDLYSKAVDKKSVSDARSAADFVYRLKLHSEFACVRDAEALAKLPEQEKLAWSALWSEVDSLSKKAGRR